MFQFQSSTQLIRSNSQNQSTINQTDLSITSINNDIYQDLQYHTFLQYQPDQQIFSRQIYPDVFKSYPTQVIIQLRKFGQRFIRHSVMKILNYQLSFSFFYLQISYKINTFINGKYIVDTDMKYSFELLSFYLKIQAIANLYKIKEIIKILQRKIDIRQNYNFTEKCRQLFKEFLQNKSNQINVHNDGIALLKQIDQFVSVLLGQSKNMHCQREQIIQKINLNLFTEIYIIDQLLKLMSKTQYSNLTIIQSKLSTFAMRKQLSTKTKSYIKNFYKQIYKIYQQYPNSRQINQLLYLFIVVKISNDDLPIKLLRFIQNQKKKVTRTSKILQCQNINHFIMKTNLYFRAQLPRIHLLMKSKGFMKLSSFLNQAELKDIQAQIQWCLMHKENLK